MTVILPDGRRTAPTPRFLPRGAGGSTSTQGVQRSSGMTMLPGGGPRFSPRFGRQERGSGTDGVANTRRRGPITDPNSLPRFITPDNTLRRQRLGFDVREVSPDTSGISDLVNRLKGFSSGEGGAGIDHSTGFLDFLKGQVRGDLEGGLNREDLIRRQFESQLPFLQSTFRDQAEGIAEQTSALGRTGSGLVDRQFAELENEQELKRRGLLGQLTAEAAGQAIQDRLGLLGRGQGLAGVTAQRAGIDAQSRNAARNARLSALQTALGGAQSAAQLGLQGGLANQQVDLDRGRFLERQQSREDMLARQAMQDRMNRLQLLRQGFASDPTGQLQREAATNLAGANEFGANAAGANAGLGGLAQAAFGSGILGGGGGDTTGALIDLFSGPSSGPVMQPGQTGISTLPQGPGLINDRFVEPNNNVQLGGLL